MTTPATTPADVLVIFGITGDLARKMTFRSLYRLERRKQLDCPIVGVALDDWSVATLRDRAREAIEAGGETLDEDVFARFAKRLSMVSGDFADAKTYERVAKAIEGKHTPSSISRYRRRCSAASSRGWRTPTSPRAPGSWWRSPSAMTWSRRERSMRS